MVGGGGWGGGGVCCRKMCKKKTWRRVLLTVRAGFLISSSAGSDTFQIKREQQQTISSNCSDWALFTEPLWCTCESAWALPSWYVYTTHRKTRFQIHSASPKTYIFRFICVFAGQKNHTCSGKQTHPNVPSLRQCKAVKNPFNLRSLWRSGLVCLCVCWQDYTKGKGADLHESLHRNMASVQTKRDAFVMLILIRFWTWDFFFSIVIRPSWKYVDFESFI